MSVNIKVTKRSGKKEVLNLEKIHRVVNWAAEGLTEVSVSQVELNAHLQFYDGISTTEIHETLIKAAADLISDQAIDYQYLAARLAMFNLRKKAYGSFAPPKLYDHVVNLVNLGKYDASLLNDYTKEEFERMETMLIHARDLSFSYAAVKQLESKYLLQNRVTQEYYESPQFAFILIAACIFANYDKDRRMSFIASFYEALSTFKISMPTPIMAGLRSPTRQFSSCVLIEADDSLDSINATASAIVKYVSQRAGIGVNAGSIRAIGSPIRKGEAYHTGCIPFYKYFQTAVKSCSQGGVRGGAATLFYPIWHLEIESLLVLKNNRGIEDNRVRHLDYGVQFNRLMYQRLIDNKKITLFSPHDVPDMYQAFFANQDVFETLYVQAENNPKIRKKSINAIELFSLFAAERANTGRIYLQNVDHCNNHSPFNAALAPIRQSNLCMEIALPTKPLKHIHDDEGEISLCTLAAVNLGQIDDLAELEPLAELLVRGLDAILDYQDYPLPAAKKATTSRRPLGIGVINFAYYLAKNKLKYSDGSANSLTHKTFEAIQFYLLKASNQLAKEQGACTKFAETNYALGLLPIDTYKKELDKLCNEPLHLNWENLRRDILKHGLRNSTLTSQMPAETSSQISNATNGVEPPRGFVSVKASKDGILKQVVPDYKNLQRNYELLWDIPDNKGYLQLMAIIQKFFDQAISVNTNYDPEKFIDGKVPMKLLLEDILIAYKLGIKTLYYHNTRDGAGQELGVENKCESGACSI